MSQASVLERQMLELINEERTSRGLDPVALELRLNDSSEDHSQWMLDEDRFSHTGENGSSAGDRMRDAGFEFEGSWSWGENIAYQSERGVPGFADDVIDLHNSLMNSQGHRANILDPDFEVIGLGIEIGEFSGFEVVMVTQNFADTAADLQIDQAAPNPPASQPEAEPPVVDEPAPAPEEPLAEAPNPDPEPPVAERPDPAPEEPVAEAPAEDPTEPEPKDPVADGPDTDPEVPVVDRPDPAPETPREDVPEPNVPVAETPDVQTPTDSPFHFFVVSFVANLLNDDFVFDFGGTDISQQNPELTFMINLESIFDRLQNEALNDDLQSSEPDMPDERQVDVVGQGDLDNTVVEFWDCLV